MNTIEKIKAELEAFNQKKLELVEQLGKEFPTMFKELFDKSDKITSVGWTQYTPYFNDGDSCEFHANIDYLYINGEHEEELENLDWRLKYYLKGDEKYKNLLIEKPNIDAELYKQIQSFKDVLNSIPDDFYLDLFGDHVKVTIYKDGTVKTEEFYHD